MIDKWDKRFMEVADMVAKWSKDPSTQVGCVLVKNRNILATGYNGFARGVEDTEARYNDRPTKYLMVIHAELNAVLQARESLIDAIAYVTHKPCSQCAAALIQAGIKTIVTRNPTDGIAERFKESFAATNDQFFDAGITIKYVDF